MNIPIDRINALSTFGYTEREAEFLYMVATFSGFFVQRQFASYLGIKGRGPITDLITKTLQKEHAREYRAENGSRKMYHLFSHSLYAAIGKENSRNRKVGRYGLLDKPSIRILTLDFVLAHTHEHYLEEEADKVEYLTKQEGISPDVIPGHTQLDQIVRQKDPELLKAVEHLARNETHTGISLLQSQGRITEISNPQERIAAIAKDYASNPETTLIVSPDNASRRDINQAVRIELQGSGALGKENLSLPVLVARNDMSGADRAWAASYNPGDTLQYIRGSQQLGLKKNTYATVLATDPANNLLTVARADGQHVVYDPQRLRGVNVYTNLPCEFSTGDRIQFTHNNKDLYVHNRDRGWIEAISNDDRLTVKMDDGRTVSFDPARMRHFDHGYAVTSHSSQGLTEDRVLVNMDTNTFSELLNPRFAYVSISRASQDAHIYTNEAATLAQRLSTDVTKTSALDFHEAPAHSQSQTPKEHTMQHHNELKPEQPSQLTPDQSEHNRQYAPIERSLQTEAHGYKWQRETDGIHSYQHPETHRRLHIDSQGQFFDRHAQPITRENALEKVGPSLTQSVAENAQSPTGSGLNLNSHGITL